MLWGGGSPFSVDKTSGDLKDCNGKKTYLMGAVRQIMHELKLADPAKWGPNGVSVGVASSCDEPSWARECISKFQVAPDGTTLADVISPNLIEIYKARSKQVHLTAISKAANVDFRDIMFLDNERGNW